MATYRLSDIDDAITKTLNDGPTKAESLVLAVKREHSDIREMSVRTAIWRLLSDRRIHMTEDYRLALNGEPREQMSQG